MNEWLMKIVAGNEITVIAGVSAGIWWIIHRTFLHQGQIKNLETKIDHVDQKIDTLFSNLKDYMDKRVDRMEDYMKKMNEVHREDMQNMDAKWERLFERLLLQDQQKSGHTNKST